MFYKRDDDMNYSIKINNLTKEYKLYKNDKDRFKDYSSEKDIHHIKL